MNANGALAVRPIGTLEQVSFDPTRLNLVDASPFQDAMLIHQGKSACADGADAVSEATRDWPKDATPEVVFAFASPKQDAEGVARALAERFPSAIVVGCSTTGEHLNGEHLRGSLVLSALSETGIRWSATAVEGLSGVTGARAGEAASSLFRGVGADPEEVDPGEYFCLSFIDGLCGCEESVTSVLAEALQGVKLLGGSAGDDLAFAKTKVIYGGRAFSDGVVLLLGHAKGRFHVFKHQHFETTPRRLAVTKADVAARRVYEIDGLPALDAYAEALGLEASEVTGDVTFMNPVTFVCSGEIYVRSIQKVNDDKSITFYCAVEEGVVLEIGGHSDIVDRLAGDVASLTGERGPFDFMLGYNCILRALETDQRAKVEAVGAVWRRAGVASLGFDTYGEQLDGLHINQTLVAIGIRRAA